MFAFYIVLIPLGKMQLQLFFLQLCVKSRVDWSLEHWYGTLSRRRKTEFKPVKLHLKFDLVSHLVHVEGLGKYVCYHPDLN